MSNEMPENYDSGDAIATAPKHVIEYNITDAALADLAKRHKNVDAAKDYPVAKLAATECQKLRKGLEEKRVELKADALGTVAPSMARPTESRLPLPRSRSPSGLASRLSMTLRKLQRSSGSPHSRHSSQCSGPTARTPRARRWPSCRYGRRSWPPSRSARRFFRNNARQRSAPRLRAKAACASPSDTSRPPRRKPPSWRRSARAGRAAGKAGRSAG